MRDDGRGIDPEVLEHSFDPFHTTRLIEGGTGLGLSVGHGIVVDHGGAISVESEPARGPSVTVELPFCAHE
jgi:C4-dicarboxylate-specific signal transduction histidine kinase